MFVYKYLLYKVDYVSKNKSCYVVIIIKKKDIIGNNGKIYRYNNTNIKCLEKNQWLQIKNINFSKAYTKVQNINNIIKTYIYAWKA